MEGVYNVVKYSATHELTNLRSSTAPLTPNAYEFMCAAHSCDRLRAFSYWVICLQYTYYA